MNESTFTWTLFIVAIGGVSVICYFVEIIGNLSRDLKKAKGRTNLLLLGVEALFWYAIGAFMIWMLIYVWNGGIQKWS